MNVIIFDFEVFRYDTLLGAILITDEGQSVFQSWDAEEIKAFYEAHKKDSIWIGHNNISYDNRILEAIVKGYDVYATSKMIVEGNGPKGYLNIDLISYDLMHPDYFSLKATEAVCGKNISESEVPFDIPRPLTEAEKEETESYNRDDINQTLFNFQDPAMFGRFRTKMGIIKEFNLPLTSLSATETSLAVKCLGAKKIENIEYQFIDPPVYPQLQIYHHKELLDFYFSEDFKNGEEIELDICGLTHKMGDGGTHAAKKNCRIKKALYLDVSGYYNLLMINLDLLPRTMPPESKKRYCDMYKEQLTLKETDPLKRKAYKTVLLCVWGAMRNEYSPFYDPEKGQLMTITGQLFITDLLEKLEPYITLIQTNTDGVIVEPKDWKDEKLILSIVDEWINRTGFTIKPKYIYDIVQRDVNNYIYRDGKGEIEAKGESVKHWNSEDHIFENKMWDSKEATIIAKCIVEYFMNGQPAAVTVQKHKDNMVLFQQLCKKGSYEYLTFDKEGENGKTSVKIQNVNRVFADKDTKNVGMVFKHKTSRGKHMMSKIPSLPPSVFVYNSDINNEEAKKEIGARLDYDYYIRRANERIAEFIDFPILKDITVYD